MTAWINHYCRWENAKRLWQKGGRLLLPEQPAFIACCGCLQFDKACNSQYLGVA